MLPHIMRKQFVAIYILLFIIAGSVGVPLHLESGIFDLKDSHVSNVVELNTASRAGDGIMQFIVHFKEHLDFKSSREIIESCGCKVLSYIPESSWAISCKGKSRQLLSKLDVIQGIVVMNSDMRIASSLKERSFSVMSVDEKVVLSFLVIEGEVMSFLSHMEEAISDNRAEIKNVMDTDHPYNTLPFAAIEIEVAVTRAPDVVAVASAHEGMHWAEEKPSYYPMNKYSVPVLQSNVAEQFSIWDIGVKGENYVVGLADTGIDKDHCFFYDPDHPIPKNHVSNDHRKIYSYKIYSDFSDDTGGHGTHTAGTVLGYMGGSGKDTFAGGAPGAKIYFQDIGKTGSESLSVPPSLFSDAYHDGVRIHSDSWGTNDLRYTTADSYFDNYMATYDDMLCLFAAGNSGDRGSGSVCAPALSKNCIGVGATLNTWEANMDQCCPPGAGCCSWRSVLESEAGKVYFSQESVPSFSSYGPTRDGRMKPDVVAPGDPLFSSYSDGPSGSADNCGVADKRGTSMATPLLAGHAVLYKEILETGRWVDGTANPSIAISPSAALLKAVIIHSAVALTGFHEKDFSFSAPVESPPNHLVGYGRPLMESVFPTTQSGPLPHSLKFFDRQPLENKERFDYCFRAGDGADVMASLVWWDRGGSPASSRMIINDLDLFIFTGEKTVWGNAGVYNTIKDDRNTNERAVLPAADIASQGSDVLVSVRGASVPYGPQTFALVVSGEFLQEIECDQAGLAGRCASDCSHGGTCTEGACVCRSGFEGADCSISECPSACSGHGDCEGTSCVCYEGWAGPDCSQQLCAPMTVLDDFPSGVIAAAADSSVPAATRECAWNIVPSGGAGVISVSMEDFTELGSDVKVEVFSMMSADPDSQLSGVRKIFTADSKTTAAEGLAFQYRLEPGYGLVVKYTSTSSDNVRGAGFFKMGYTREVCDEVACSAAHGACLSPSFLLTGETALPEDKFCNCPVGLYGRKCNSLVCAGMRTFFETDGRFAANNPPVRAGEERASSCGWAITPTADMPGVIRVTFTDLDLWENTEISVYQGLSDDGAVLLASLTKGSPSTVEVNGSLPGIYVNMHHPEAVWPIGSFSASFNVVKDCNVHPCENNGTCSVVSGECSCLPGYIGHVCQRGHCVSTEKSFVVPLDGSADVFSSDGIEAGGIINKNSSTCKWNFTGATESNYMQFSFSELNFPSDSLDKLLLERLNVSSGTRDLIARITAKNTPKLPLDYRLLSSGYTLQMSLLREQGHHNSEFSATVMAQYLKPDAACRDALSLSIVLALSLACLILMLFVS